jgi:hypothetical protein
MDYLIPVTAAEEQTLAWLADRYTTAETLWSCIGYADDDDDSRILRIPETVAWRYVEELKDENGNPDQFLPTCVGGTLADKLVDFYNSIV